MTKYFNVQRFNNATGKLDPLQMYSIGYVRCGRSGNMIVTFCNPSIPTRLPAYRQQIVVLPGLFYKVLPSVRRDIVASCIEITPAQLLDLGFIIVREGVYSNDARVAVNA